MIVHSVNSVYDLAIVLPQIVACVYIVPVGTVVIKPWDGYI